ncbi:MAG: M16 family metallopeptidase [Candidatus Velthaea sp.]
MNRTALCALLTAALTATAAAAPLRTTAVDIGGAKLYAQSDDSALLAGVQFFVRAGLDREGPQQNGLAALSAETILSTPVDGMALRDAVAARGGQLTATVGQHDVRFYVEAPPAALPAIAALAAKALAAPDTSAGPVAAARTTLAARIAEEERNPVSVGLAMLRQSYYDGGGGMPVLGTNASLAALRGSDVRAFVAAHYRSGGSLVTAVGRVTPDVTAAARVLAATLPAGTEPLGITKVRPMAATPKRIVTQRDIGVTYVVLGFAAPAPGDRDFGPMLILRSLLADVFVRPSSTTLPSYARAVGVMYAYDAKPASLALYINGAQLSPSAGIGGVDAVLKSVAGKPFNASLLKRYKSSAHGEWQTETISLSDRAWSIGNFIEQGVDPDYAQTALAAIDAATAADVQRAAKAYLQHFTVALISPRETPNTK